MIDERLHSSLCQLLLVVFVTVEISPVFKHSLSIIVIRCWNRKTVWYLLMTTAGPIKGCMHGVVLHITPLSRKMWTKQLILT